ncbi:replication initiator [Streptomyces pimonensis]|uniref:replication initiator n=1 Tax=Streptomyces pimonensis TaxID=2860288 RepID=UPI00352824CB
MTSPGSLPPAASRSNQRVDSRQALKACLPCVRRYVPALLLKHDDSFRRGKGHDPASAPSTTAPLVQPGPARIVCRCRCRCRCRCPCRCGTLHTPDDPALGTALDADTYDYETAVPWNAHAGLLRRRFSICLGREDAKRAGLAQRAFREYARVSFAKVAEYQKRGAVHSHAVIRSDGPEGGDTPLPVWATAELLTDATRAAATAPPGRRSRDRRPRPHSRPRPPARRTHHALRRLQRRPGAGRPR